MDLGQLDGGPFAKLDHVGIIVRDIDKAIAAYQSLGIGPFGPLPQLNVLERTLRGKPAVLKLNARIGQVGQTRVELIQPVSGESLQKEFLDNKGEGIHHLAFETQSLEKDVSKLKLSDSQIIYRGKFGPSGGFVYFAIEPGGCLVELIEWPRQA